MANFKLQHDRLLIRTFVFEGAIQHVRSLLVVVEHYVSADCRDLVGEAEARTQSPPSDVELMNSLIAQVAIPVIPEPVPVIVEMILGKGLQWRRTGPRIVMNSRRNRRNGSMTDRVSPLEAQAAGQVDITKDCFLLQLCYRIHQWRRRAKLSPMLNNPVILRRGPHQLFAFP